MKKFICTLIIIGLAGSCGYLYLQNSKLTAQASEAVTPVEHLIATSPTEQVDTIETPKIDYAQMLVDEIDNELKFVVMEVNGEKQANYVRYNGNNKIASKIANAEFKATYKWQAAFILDGSAVHAEKCGNYCLVKVTESAIKCDLIDFKEAQIETCSDLFGRDFNATEGNTIMMNTKAELMNELNTQDNYTQCKINFEQYIKNLAKEIGCNDLVIEWH